MTDLKNDTRRDDLEKEIRAWGRDRIKGDESFCKLGCRLTKAAQEGIVTLDRDSDQTDDAMRMYSEFSKAETSRVFADKTMAKKAADSARAQVSKVRTFIKLGCAVPTGIDGFEILEKAVALHKNAVETKQNVKGAYTALVDVARSQLAKDVSLTHEEIVAAITPKEGNEKSVESIARQHKNGLEKLITGQAGVTFDGDEALKGAIIDAHDTLRDALAAFTVQADLVAKRKQAIELAAELGMEFAAPVA